MGQSRCFGFVTFTDPVTADAMLQRTHIVDSRRVRSFYIYSSNKSKIDVKRAVIKDSSVSVGHVGGVLPSSIEGRQDRSNEAKVFVGGLHPDTDDSEIHAALSRFGEVTQISLMRDKDTGQSRRYAFVGFLNRESADLACGNTEVYIREKQIEIKSAHPKTRYNVSNSLIAAGGLNSQTSSTENYAAWTEYLKANPEYYEKLMAAYACNPESLNAYYRQMYGGHHTTDFINYDTVDNNTDNSDSSKKKESKDRISSSQYDRNFHYLSDSKNYSGRDRCRSPESLRNTEENGRRRRESSSEREKSRSHIERDKYYEKGDKKKNFTRTKDFDGEYIRVDYKARESSLSIQFDAAGDKTNSAVEGKNRSSSNRQVLKSDDTRRNSIELHKRSRNNR